MGAIKGIGTDLVGIARLAEALDRSPSLARRLFTPAELSSGGDGGTSAPGSAGSPGVSLEDDTPSEDDEDAEEAGVVGLEVVKRLLGATVLEEVTVTQEGR